MTAPQTATLTTSSPVAWSSGDLFSGYILIGLALPTDATGTQYAQVNLWGSAQALPEWTVVPVIQGVVDSNTTVFFSTNIDPPNTRYLAYWYDNTWKRISPASGVTPGYFTVAASPYTITPPTLTVPGVPSSSIAPVPQTDTSAPVQPTYATFGEYSLTGVTNSVNTVFTIPVTPTVTAFIFIDGQKQDISTYNRVGPVVTFLSAPLSGSSITALVV